MKMSEFKIYYETLVKCLKQVRFYQNQQNHLHLQFPQTFPTFSPTDKPERLVLTTGFELAELAIIRVV